MPCRTLLLAGLSLALAAPAMAQTAPAATAPADQPRRAMDINPTPNVGAAPMQGAPKNTTAPHPTR
jgi:hypothetical protein